MSKPLPSARARKAILRHLDKRVPQVGRTRAAEEVLEALLAADWAWDELLLALYTRCRSPFLLT